MSSSRWYARSIEDVEAALDARAGGLLPAEAARRLGMHGGNTLPTAPPESMFHVFLRQFKSPLIYLLLGAAAILYATADHTDAYIILGILIFNAIVGTIQEGRARDTLSALRTFAKTHATVRRDGKDVVIAGDEVVPGDILQLAEGGKVAADARIILSRGLRIDEAALTGESEPVEKDAQTLADTDLVVGDQTNMVFKGTNVVAGQGTAVVVATGSKTEFGSIARNIAEDATEIPLQAGIRRLSRLIIIIVALISTFLFVVGILEGRSLEMMFATVVTLAVSIIPEGLPIVMTLVLATGVWRMGKRNALVKNLAAVEALGQASVIAVDKTGTLTKNEMVVERVYTAGTFFSIEGDGYTPTGVIRKDEEEIEPLNHPELLLAAKIAAYTATARVAYDDETRRYVVAGDPTEAALIVFARKVGFEKEALEHESPVLAELPFTSELRYHATLHDGARKRTLSMAGAPEYILAHATHVQEGTQVKVLTAQKRDELEEAMIALSSRGLRVIAFAERANFKKELRPEHVDELTFVGFYGMKDGLKREVPDALARAQAAGIRVAMITGDHVVTARAIAKEAGIPAEDGMVITGTELDGMGDKELANAVFGFRVYARVTPAHKLRIIRAYRAAGHVVAMTGDGINDAPSLVAADLGVAMGKIGTDVAKEAADIVLLDDDFGSIISAVEEGRGIYRSIERVVLYLFSTSLGEAVVITGALLASLPLPLLPAQIIWLNFVTDGFLDIALGAEPKERDLLTRRFKRPGRYLIDRLMALRMLLMASVMGTMTLWLFIVFIPEGLPKALTVSLTVLAVMQWFNAWNCRSDRESIFTMNPFTNPALLAATGIVVLLQLFALYHPLGNQLLHTVPLSGAEWQIILLAALPIILAEEIRKAFARLLSSRPQSSRPAPALP